MIHAIRCDQPGFKEVIFGADFNVILAVRTKESTRRDSRNGLGKSTLVEIIHFCLGSSLKKGKGIAAEPLEGWTFSIDLTLSGKRVIAYRNTASPSKVVVDADTRAWPVRPKPDAKTGQPTLSVKDWTTVLGFSMFGIPLEGFGSLYQPTFRSLISYFVRRGRDAYSTPFEHYRKQLEWDKQVNNAFLLGLAWEDASDWQLLKDKKSLLDDLKRAAKSGMMAEVLGGTLGELDAARVRLEEKFRHAEEQLRDFRVHPQYREVQHEVDHLTEEIHRATNENFEDGQLLDLYQTVDRDEREPSEDDVIRLYQEAGVSLPGLALRRLEDVRTFHRQLVENRRRFLSDEIARLRRAIDARERATQTMSERRASLMGLLQTHGALDEYTKLQQFHLEDAAKLNALVYRIENLRRFEEGRSALRIEEEELILRARRDYDERRAQRQRAIAIFNANSETLYDAPGNLVIDVGKTGFAFKVEIKRDGSEGIESMKVFCYDMLLAELWARREHTPGFLIHDSTIFDGVDERQKAHALELAARKSLECGFQYICMLNSDAIPWKDFTPSFNLDSYVRLSLTDATDDGGLLGLRF